MVRDFHLIEVTGEDVDNGTLLSALSEIGWAPSESYLISGDIGGSPSPTELMVSHWFQGAWVELGRVHLTLSDSFQTATAIHQVNISLPRPATLITIDAHSHGVGVYDWLHRNEAWAMYEYGQKVVDADHLNVVQAVVFEVIR